MLGDMPIAWFSSLTLPHIYRLIDFTFLQSTKWRIVCHVFAYWPKPKQLVEKPELRIIEAIHRSQDFLVVRWRFERKNARIAICFGDTQFPLHFKSLLLLANVCGRGVYGKIKYPEKIP